MKQVNGLWRWGTLAAVGVAGVAVVIAVRGGGTAGESGTPTPRQLAEPVKLVGYSSCDTALSNLRDAARPYVGPYGFGGEVMIAADSGGRMEPGAVPQSGAGAPESGAAKQAAPEHSGTTVNQAGVDEPDLVKTDGRRIVSVVDGTVRVVDAATHKLTGSAELPQGRATNLLLDGDRALVLAGGDTVISDVPDIAGPKPQGQGATLVLVDVANGVRVLGSLRIDGSYVDARQTGHVARVVVRSSPTLKFVTPQNFRDQDEAKQQNLRVLDDSTIDDWLPSYELSTGGTTRDGRLVGCAAVRHPADYSGTSMLTVLSLDLTKDLGTGDPVAIAADGDTVYGSGPNLYVADDHRLMPMRPDRKFAPEQGNTAIYQFDVAQPGRPVYVASGTVPGALLNQYSLSEYNGSLRVATMSGAGACCSQRGGADNAISVLQRQGDQLVQVGRLGGLGPGERIYAVRFIANRGYVVTFRQTDPLYTVDLSDPRNPRKAGELKINGYSSYLHDIGNGRLLGIGADATSGGSRTGLQVSLFDVNDASAPKRLAQYSLSNGYSEAEADPHAFLYWAPTGTVVIPAASTMSQQASTGAVVLHVSENKLTQVGTLAQPAGGSMVRRSMVIGNDLWVVSDQGILANTLTGLRQQAWIPFG